MATVTLKITFPAGTPTKYKLMKCKLSATARETIEELLKTNVLSHLAHLRSDQFVLMQPSSTEGSAIWFDDTKFLSNYQIQEKVSISLAVIIEDSYVCQAYTSS